MSVVLVLGFVMGMVATAAWVRETIREQDAQRAADSAQTVYPQPVACAVADLDADVEAAVHSRVGASVPVTITVRNSGSRACLFDTGAASLGLIVRSGGQTLLSSTQCPAHQTGTTLLVGPDEVAQVVLTWDAMVGTSDCLPDDGATASAQDGGEEDEAAGSTLSTQPAADGATAPAADSGAQATQQPSQHGSEAGSEQTPTPAPTPSARATSSPRPTVVGTDEYVTQVSVSGQGGYAQAGTYELQLVLDGEELGPRLPLVIS